MKPEDVQQQQAWIVHDINSMSGPETEYLGLRTEGGVWSLINLENPRLTSTGAMDEDIRLVREWNN